MLDQIVRFAIRIFAFTRKEVIEVLRQPRLVVTLIAGPFLILALFGMGYRTETPTIDAIFVANEQGEFATQIEQRLEEADSPINLVDIVEDDDAALRQLRTGAVDIVVIAPGDPIGTIKSDEQAEFIVLHSQLDPFERATLTLLARTTVDQVNREVLTELVESGQTESEDLDDALPVAIDSADAMADALRRGDTDDARSQRERIGEALTEVETTLGGRASLVEAIERQISTSESTLGATADFADIRASLDSVELADTGRPLEDEAETVETIAQRLREMRDIMADFQSVQPEVLVSPFGMDASSIAATELSLTDFYAPGVIALLLQHLTITFAGLSFVRERQVGAVEVFRVSPVRTVEMLVGKYLGYLAVASTVAAALSALTFWVARVPLAGSFENYVAVVVLLLTSSLGIGFVLSALVTTDSQAVNFAMILLLVSIFFSGFFLSLDRLEPLVQTVSWSLPITHALDSLRDIMFRGTGIDARTLLALGGGSVGLFGLAWWLVARRVAQS